MTNETKHTPTPWDTMGSLVIRVEGPTSYMVARASSSEDAAHIVKCVNMHDELVEALKKIANNEFKDADELWCSEAMAIFVARLNDIAADALKKAGEL